MNLLLPATLLLAGCAHPPIIESVRTVEVPVKVYVDLPADLTRDCPPAPVTGTTVKTVIDRALSVERALRECRCQLAQIRSEKDSPLCQ